MHVAFDLPAGFLEMIGDEAPTVRRRTEGVKQA